eukprot:TRINITY_DN22828_c0_g2_i3.p2 TRINITY_DN22828_c0_g2~~TRINITY_DN22828_c0_g2_i3.p2  ORF type:complete len:634 (-),score=140.83 TRINITY_DN22828_c0_g2_i3:451-2352(-)
MLRLQKSSRGLITFAPPPSFPRDVNTVLLLQDNGDASLASESSPRKMSAPKSASIVDSKIQCACGIGARVASLVGLLIACNGFQENQVRFCVARVGMIARTIWLSVQCKATRAQDTVGMRRIRFSRRVWTLGSRGAINLFLVEPADGEPIVQRGKLMLVDLAGSESLKKVEAADAGNEALRRQQAIGINRVLTSLGTVVNNMNKGMSGGHRDSVLTMLLHDCLGGTARAMLVANIAPERDNSAEVLKTLTFSQQMTSVRSTATVHRITKEQSSIMQIRQRHIELLRVMEQEPHEEKEKEKLRKEVEDMGNRLLTRESAEKTLADMQREHTQKIEELKVQMAESMSKELAELRRQSLGDMEELRQSISSHMTGVGSAQLQKQSEEHEAKITKIAAEHDETRRQHRDAEQEANALKVKVASAEERAQMLQSRLDEFMKERSGTEEDRRSMRQQSEQQWQRVAAAEGELQKYKAENASQAADIERLHAARKEDAEAANRERDAAQARQDELQRKNTDLWQQISDSKREREIAQIKLEAEKREAITKLEMQIERMTMEVEVSKEQMKQLQHGKVAMEAEIQEVKREKDESIRQLHEELNQAHEDLEESNAEKTELLDMLHEMQQSVISRRTSTGGRA